MSDAIPDQRRESRAITLHRASVIESGLQRGLCVIKNLSTGGAMIRTSIELSTGDPLVLVMASGMRIEGTVRWTQPPLAGIQFDTPTPLSLILDRGGVASGRGAHRRMPRVEIVAPARISGSFDPVAATVCDISTHGMRFSCDAMLALGRVRIDLPHLAPIAARILWSVNDQFGCIFDKAFEIDDLTAWILRTEHHDAKDRRD